MKFSKPSSKFEKFIKLVKMGPYGYCNDRVDEACLTFSSVIYSLHLFGYFLII